jgi:hypothetical protein
MSVANIFLELLIEKLKIEWINFDIISALKVYKIKKVVSIQNDFCLLKLIHFRT